jgi:hypothetical protein
VRQRGFLDGRVCLLTALDGQGVRCQAPDGRHRSHFSVDDVARPVVLTLEALLATASDGIERGWSFANRILTAHPLQFAALPVDLSLRVSAHFRPAS